MPDLEISNLTALPEANVAATDPLAIVDVSGSETKKITVKDLIAAGVALIDNGDIPAAKVGTLGTNQVASGALVDGAVTNVKIETSTSATTGIDGGTKIRAGSITVDRLDSTKFDRGLSVASGKLGITNNITAATKNGITYTAQGLISATGDLAASDLPVATASAIGAVSVPTSGKLTVDGNGALSLANVSGLSAGSYAKVTVNVQGQVTAGTTLIATDIPIATTSARGAVIVSSSGGLAVDGTGNISIATQGSVSAGSYAKVTVNTKGIVTATGSLADTDIPNHSAAKLTSGTLPDARIANSAITTVRLNNGAVTNDKIETSTSSSTGIDGATKIRDSSITPAKINASNLDRSINIASGNLGINNSITGATRSGITFNNQGLITGTVALAAGDLPLATTSAVGGVSVGAGLSVSGAGALSIANSVTAATVSGITFNARGQITAATALVAGDLPTATTSAKGGVSVASGGGLSVSGAGALSTATSGISAGTFTKLTVNNKGVATAGASLVASDIPDLSAAKITSGTLAAARIGADTIDSSKLSNSSTTIIQSIAQLGYPTAAFTGQLLFDPIAEDAYLWDGNAWNPITTLTKGALVRLGTYNASTSKVDYVTAAGSAAGLTVGQNLPVASESVDGGYVVISVQGTPSGIAGITGQLSPPDYLLGVTASASTSNWVEIDLSTTVASQQASSISYTPHGQLSSTNVQAALNEIEDEKLAKGGGTVTGEILIGNAGSLVFEGATADAFETTLTVADPTTSDKTITLPNVTGTVITTGDTNTVTSTMVDASLANANLAANAAISFSKLASLTAAQILVGNGSNVATAVAVTGDISINNAGLTAIAAGAIVDADINSSAAISGSKIVAGTTSVVGVVQLTDSAASSSTTTAATPAAVKVAKDAADAAATTANAALPKAGGTMTGNLILDNAKELRLSEGDGDGSNYTALKAQAQTGDITLTLPAVAPTAGYVLKANASTPTTLEWAADSASAAGSNTQVQFNNNGAFAGSASLVFNSGTGALTATSFVGDLTGTASAFTVTANNSTDETVYPLFADGATGSQGAETDTGLTYNPSTGLLTATGFSGAGTSLTALNASNLSSGTVAAARLGTGSSVSTKFLRGDNTWQTVSSTPEGTAILSTGESGTSKFLRVDGDGTCSWQTVTGFVSTSNASTSTGQLNLEMPGNEALRITQNFDSKIILQGSSNPFITFRESTTAKAVIGWNSDGYFKLENSEDGSQLRIQDDLKFSVDGTTFYSVLTTNSSVNAATAAITDESSDATCFPLFATAATGNLALHTGSNLTFNSATGILTAGGISADVTGNLTGNVTGTIQTGAQANITSLGTLTGLVVDGDMTLTGQSANVVWDKSTDDLIFNDDAKAIFGTSSDGLEIYHDGSDSLILDTGTGRLNIRTNGDSIKLQNTNGGQEAMGVFNSNGSVELYHDGTKKFETSATGATVSGTLAATAVTGDGSGLTNLPASGGSITATADGAIAAGDRLIINTDGTVKKAQILVTELSTYTANSTATDSANYGFSRAHGCYHAHHGLYLWFGKLTTSSPSTSGRPVLRAYTFGTSSTTSANAVEEQETELQTFEGHGDNWSIEYCPTKERSLAVFGKESSSKQAYYALIQATSGTAFSVVGSVTEWHSSEVRYAQSCYTKDEKFVVVYVDYQSYSTQYVKSRVFTLASDGNSLTVGSEVTLSGSNQAADDINVYYDANSDKVVAVYTDQGTNGGLVARVGTVSGSSISWGSATSADSSIKNSGGYFKALYMPDHAMGACAWTGTGEGTIVQTLTISSGTISWGAKYYPGTGSSQDTWFPTIAYDELTNKPVVFYQTTNDFKGAGKVLSVSGTSLSQHKDLGDIITPSQYQIHVYRDCTWHSGLDNIIVPFSRFYNQQNATPCLVRIQSATTATNLTTENFIGCAQSAVSDGNTATVDISGSSNSSQSGLTAGQKYFVQNDGSLGLTAATPAVFGGTAISSTKLLVNDQQPVPTLPLDEVDEWGQFTGDGNSSYGPWSTLNGQWGNGTNSSRQQGTLTRVSVSGMPKGTGMTNSNGVFTFPSTGKWHITVHMFVQRYDQNALANLTLQLSTNSGSSWLAGPDSTGLCFGTFYVHSTYGTKTVIPLSAIVDVTDISTYRVRVNVETAGGNMYMRPGSRITFMKIA